jgi:hypothetical protein
MNQLTKKKCKIFLKILYLKQLQKKNKNLNKFDIKPFFGKIIKYSFPTTTTTTVVKDSNDDELFHVVYEDGDEEDLNSEEFEKSLQLYYELLKKKMTMKI